MIDILVIYDSRHGATESLARVVCRGIDQVDGASARLRKVPQVSAVSEATADAVPGEGPPYVEISDLAECGGLVVGSPTRFGNMTAALKYFFDSTSGEWLSGTLAGKPAGIFTSTASLHGGQESTLLSMALPLLHHGMLIVGLPYTEPDLSSTTTGGTPYGASHVTFSRETDRLSEEEERLATALGRRVARIATALASGGLHATEDR